MLQTPILLGLQALRCMGIFVKQPMVYIETIDIPSKIQCRLASQQIKKGEYEEYQTEYQVAPEVPTVREMCQPPAEESKVSIDMINHTQAIPDYISEGTESEYDIEEQWYNMDELDQLVIYEIQNSPEDLKVHPDYISTEADYHL